MKPKLENGFHQARADLGPARCSVVNVGTERFPLATGIEAISLRDLAAELQKIA